MRDRWVQGSSAEPLRETPLNMTLAFVRENRSLQGRILYGVFVVVIGLHSMVLSQQAPPMPVISADLGSCSVQFTVKDGSGKPVAGATLRVRIAYGFMGVRKLDLETSTNNEGKARFEGMPGNLKKALFFHASKDKLAGTAFYDAAKNCAAEHTIVMLPKRDESDSDSSGEQTEN
jgi:hypothetical protein